MTHDTQRSISLRRTASERYVATNARGGEIAVGSVGDDDTFTPVELLLTAIAGCTAVDVDLITGRRAQPDSFDIGVTADKIRDESGNRLANIEVTFRIAFPSGEAGDAARAVLPDAVAKSHDRLCTVSRTVELGTPIGVTIA